MKFKIDHDYHIHSGLSECSSCPDQNPARILEYAKEYGLSRVCLTDHYWDSAVPGASEWYAPQNFDHIAQSLPLPKADGIDFRFGCETDMDKYMTLGVPASRFDDFAFIIIPTTHLHMNGFTIAMEDVPSAERRAKLWVERFDHLLSCDLPFRKIGIPHLACCLINMNSREDWRKTLDLIPSAEMERLFAKAAELGCGIELNGDDMTRFTDDETDTVMRMFRIAKYQGCKFYYGSDAHFPKSFAKFMPGMERAVDLLGLEESDKFVLA